MNVIFLTMVPMSSLSGRGIYQDLLRYFVKQGHNVHVVSPIERRQGVPTNAFVVDETHFLGVRTLNLTKTNVIEKGVGQVCVESQFKQAIRKFWPNEHFGLILYSTPPITLMGTVKYLKERNPKAKSYLLLKDIFPQNAVDIGMMATGGIKGVLYRFFRQKEKSLYRESDYIGCMSPANVEFVIKHNPEVDPAKVEVAPNSVDLNVNLNLDDNVNDNENDNLATDRKPSTVNRQLIREKYNLPTDRPVFIYGGNLGKPQGIPFLMECLGANAKRTDCYFVVIGSGTELPKLQAWYRSLRSKSEESYSENLSTSKDSENSQLSTLNSQLSLTVMEGLPKAEYDELVRACDVGLIFLDHRFTIPNFPSRLLSYLENKMPVLCATDPNTDMGMIAEKNGFGFWCESNSVDAFTEILDKMIAANRQAMGEKGYQFLKDNYLVEHTYSAIIQHLV